MRRVIQLVLFKAALTWVAERPDLVNTALDVGLSEDGTAVVRSYPLP